jgi:hypothetical protein
MTAPPQQRTDPAPLDAPEHRGGRRLDLAECRAWIVGHDEARLGFDTGRGHRSVVVAYVVGTDEILLLLPEYHPATGYLADAQVTLDVEGVPAEGSWSTVRASGLAYLGLASDTAVHPRGASWPPGVATHTVHVPLAQVEGVLRAA